MIRGRGALNHLSEPNPKLFAVQQRNPKSTVRWCCLTASRRAFLQFGGAWSVEITAYSSGPAVSRLRFWANKRLRKAPTRPI